MARGSLVQVKPADLQFLGPLPTLLGTYVTQVWRQQNRRVLFGEGCSSTVEALLMLFVSSDG